MEKKFWELIADSETHLIRLDNAHLPPSMANINSVRQLAEIEGYIKGYEDGVSQNADIYEKAKELVEDADAAEERYEKARLVWLESLHHRDNIRWMLDYLFIDQLTDCVVRNADWAEEHGFDFRRHWDGDQWDCLLVPIKGASTKGLLKRIMTMRQRIIDCGFTANPPPTYLANIEFLIDDIEEDETVDYYHLAETVKNEAFIHLYEVPKNFDFDAYEAEMDCWKKYDAWMRDLKRVGFNPYNENYRDTNYLEVFENLINSDIEHAEEEHKKRMTWAMLHGDDERLEAYFNFEE